MNKEEGILALKNLYKRLKSPEFTKISALNSLYDIIEKCDQKNIRLDALNLISELKIKNERVFTLLENCLLSDESPNVRELAARLLIMDYPKNCEKVILWALKNDRSPSVLKTIEDLSYGVDGHKLEFLEK